MFLSWVSGQRPGVIATDTSEYFGPSWPDPRCSATVCLRLPKTGRLSLKQLARTRSANSGEAERRGKWKRLWDEAKQKGLNAEFLAKARQTAEELTEVQIKNLCDRIRKHQCNFGPCHLR